MLEQSGGSGATSKGQTAMTTEVAEIIEQARKLTPRAQLELIRALAGLVDSELIERDPAVDETATDPVLELIGAYASEIPLIDGISASADPDLYLMAEAMGAQGAGLHAWEIAPARYECGPDGRPVRKG